MCKTSHVHRFFYCIYLTQKQTYSVFYYMTIYSNTNVTLESAFILQHVKMESMNRTVHKIVLRIASVGYVTMWTDHVTVRQKIIGTLNAKNVSFTLSTCTCSIFQFAIHAKYKYMFKENLPISFVFVILLMFRVFSIYFGSRGYFWCFLS